MAIPNHTTKQARQCRVVNINSVALGGNNPIAVQAMTNTPPSEVDATLAQIEAIAQAGAVLARCAVPSLSHISAFAEIVRKSPIPVVADVHYDWRIAEAAVHAGAAKVRVNPGNMPDNGGLERLAQAARETGTAVRVGVNSGSAKAVTAMDKTGTEHADADTHSTPHAPEGTSDDLVNRLVSEALEFAYRFERHGLDRIVLSIKTPNPAMVVQANRRLAALCDYPIHLGLTHAGLEADAVLKSAVALGGLLLDGIGQTMRLSFTGDPVRETLAALDLLRAAGILRDRADIISCPTCGRCRVDLLAWATEVRRRVDEIPGGLTIAVMGCEVNGPGEARAADAGLAASGSGRLTLFAQGKTIGTVSPESAVDALIALARQLPAP